MSKRILLTVLVAALGYFVDVYDLILFNVVRLPSLKGLGVPESEMLSTGILLLNTQNAGLVVGGLLWGILGDKRGRLSVLFGSILVYSLANISNGFVTSVPLYAVLRFIAGVGLAGELGAGITLVAEVMPSEKRGYGTMMVAGAGMLGGITGALIGDQLPWRTSYFVGGGLGLLLLVLRIGVFESGLFEKMKTETNVSKGNFLSLFSSRQRALKYLSVIVVGLPVWLSIGILITFAPEIGRDMGMVHLPKVGRALVFWYFGMFIGDLGSGLVSQLLKGRKKAIGVWLVLCTLTIILYFSNVANSSLTVFYGICWLLGLSSGYWAVFVTVAAENFGTNVRATVTTTAPNMVRGGIILLTSGFKLGKPVLGITGSATAVAIATMLLAAIALQGVRETFHADLDYVEK